MRKRTKISEKRLNNIITESVRNILKEYIDSTKPEIWDMFAEMTEVIGGDGQMLQAIAQAIGTENLLETLRFIDRVYDLNVIQKYEQE